MQELASCKFHNYLAGVQVSVAGIKHRKAEITLLTFCDCLWT